MIGSIQGRKPTPPCIMVIFGASGDLASRKLYPALYHLEKDGLLSDSFAVIGISREALNHEAFRERITKKVPEHLEDCEWDPAVWNRLAQHFFFMPGSGEDSQTFERLKKFLSEIDASFHANNHVIFYLATPPALFSPITKGLGKAGLLKEEGDAWRRVVIEKPFGRDVESATDLNHELRQYLGESQIYRIDHYLGKETVQNIMVFRFSNGIFEPIWNRDYIDSVQITVAETLGVEGRGGYYDSAGALRDMVPSHLFQLMSMIAMEPPISFNPEDVRDEKYKVLKAIKPLSPEDVLRDTVRGQYGEGSIAGKRVAAYREELKMNPKSTIETYAALKLQVDNWRWAGVPFYLRTGKRMADRVTEVSIQFRQVPFQLFRETQVRQLSPNHLIIQIQPEEKISLQFGAKTPGPTLQIADVEMDFDYEEQFGYNPNTGYETLIYDCIFGDMTLFQRGDHVECAWSVIQPILDVWGALQPRGFANYAAGSWGPREAEDLLAREGRRWRLMGGAAPGLQAVPQGARERIGGAA